MKITDLPQFKINKLTQAQYDRELASGTIKENELYLTPDEEIDLSLYATKEELRNKSDRDHDHDNDYYRETEIDSKLAEINTAIGKKADPSFVNTSINNHDTSTVAHSDIRTLISNLTTKLNNLADSDDETLDQISEIVTYIKSNRSLIESVTTAKLNVSDVINNLATAVTDKALSANQGVELKKLIDSLQTALDLHKHEISDTTGLQEALNGKASASHGTHVSYSTTVPVMDGSASAGTATSVSRSDHKHPTDTSRASQESLDLLSSTVSAHGDSKSNPHSVTKAQVGLGNVPNVTTNDQTPTYSDTSTFATLSSGEKLSISFAKIKLAITNLINHITNKSNPHSVTKSQVGLGNVDNTSDANKPISTAVQTALNGKASSGHTHNYAGSVSSGGAANKVAHALSVEVNNLDGSTSSTMYDGSETISLAVASDTHKHDSSYLAKTPGFIEFYPGASVGYGGYLDFHFNNSSSDFTSRIIEQSSGVLNISPNLAINGTSVSDFVVAQGTSGIWRWRKWNSGAAECWGTTTYSIDVNKTYAINSDNSKGLLYYGNVAAQEWYPFTFKVVNHAHTAVRRADTPYMWPGTFSNATTQSPARVTLWSAVGAKTGVNLNVDYYCCGTWM